MKHIRFNIVNNSNNYNQDEIWQIIKQKIDYYLHLVDIRNVEGKRNYSVFYDEIKSFQFHTEKKADKGIDELTKVCQIFKFRNSNKNI